jgi:3-deoxy-7-phosphoheptulonate synthase
LRGGGGKTNFDEASVSAAVAELEAAGVNPNVMIDSSHANSGKSPAAQPGVAAVVGQQVSAGQRRIMGVMLESFLLSGNQPLEAGRPLEYGKSITDGCLSFADTLPVLEGLAAASAARRRLRAR